MGNEASIRYQALKREYGEFLTLTELAEELCVSRNTADKIAKENLSVYRFGNVRKYDCREVAKWIEETRERP